VCHHLIGFYPSSNLDTMELNIIAAEWCAASGVCVCVCVCVWVCVCVCVWV